MCARKSPAPVKLSPSHQKELELLYARRVAIDSLIRSLVDYDRLRLRRLQVLKQKPVLS